MPKPKIHKKTEIQKRFIDNYNSIPSENLKKFKEYCYKDLKLKPSQILIEIERLKRKHEQAFLNKIISQINEEITIRKRQEAKQKEKKILIYIKSKSFFIILMTHVDRFKTFYKCFKSISDWDDFIYRYNNFFT